MNPIVKAGLLLGILCGAWTFVIGFTGWYKDPVMLNMFYLVVVFEIGILIWGLRKTAALGRGYGGQVGAGMLISLIGGVIIIGSSILFTSVVFPDYFQELQGIQVQMMRAQGKSDLEIASIIAATAPMQTPVMNALTGFAATIFTGLLGSLIIAAFVRKK
jgi:hypothetical protein